MSDPAPAWVDGEVVEGQLLTNAQVERLFKMMDVLREWENYQQVSEIKLAILDARYEDARALYSEFTESEQEALWVAPTKCGIFTTHERAVLKNL